MKSVGDLSRNKRMFFVNLGESVFEVAKLMSENNIGAVPVLDEDGRLRGIFSERDLLQRCVVKKIDAENTKVDQVMTRGVIVVEAQDSYEYCLKIMRQESIRHMPVREGEKLIGVISMRDLLQADSDEKSEVIGFLNSYISY